MKQHTAQFIEAGNKLIIRVEGREHFLAMSKGGTYLMLLLQHPGKRFYALSLSKRDQVIPPEYRYLSEQSEAERQHDFLYSMGYLPPLAKADWQCVHEVSARLNHLIAKEAILMENNDCQALEDVRDEKEQLQLYLSEVLHQGGKLRRFRNAEYKAVNSVYKALSRVLAQIAECEPELGAELKRRVSSWHKLCYQPGVWEVRCEG